MTPSPKDRAIEHAGYLADSTDHLLKAVDAYWVCLDAREHAEDAELESTQGDLDQAQELLGEHISSVRSMVYEFRKRAERANDTFDAPRFLTWAEATPKQDQMVLLYDSMFGAYVPHRWKGEAVDADYSHWMALGEPPEEPHAANAFRALYAQDRPPSAPLSG